MKIYCSNCGKLSEEGDVFCQNCGTPLLEDFTGEVTDKPDDVHSLSSEEEHDGDYYGENNDINEQPLPTVNNETYVSDRFSHVLCPYCQTVQSDMNKYCENCGREINPPFDATAQTASNHDIKETTTVTKASIPSESFNSVNHSMNTPQHMDESSSLWKYLLLAALSILLVGGGSYYYFYYMPNQEKVMQANKEKEEKKQQEKEDVKKQLLQTKKKDADKKEQKKENELIPFDDQVMRSVVDAQFRNQFNIGGSHAMYYHRLTNESGDKIDAASISANGNVPIRAASVIKIFILIAFYQQVDEGAINLEDTYQLRTADKVGGTGNIQNDPPGTTYTYNQLATEMITNSDNTTANIVIDRIGGLNAVNQVIAKLGYTQTKLNRKFLDTYALSAGIDNYVTSEELGDVLTKLYQRKLINEKVDQSVLDILGKQIDREKLLKNLPTNLVIYNKTGQFSDYGVMNDAAIIVTDKGSYVLVALSMDGRYGEKAPAIARFSQNVYQQFTN